jgi:hypothetical protein
VSGPAIFVVPPITSVTGVVEVDLFEFFDAK